MWKNTINTLFWCTTYYNLFIREKKYEINLIKYKFYYDNFVKCISMY